MPRTVSDPTASCCESATDGPRQRRRFKYFVGSVVLGAACTGVLYWFGSHGDNLVKDCGGGKSAAQCKKDQDDWNKFLPAVYGPMMFFWVLALFFCLQVFCCGGRIEIPDEPKTKPAEAPVDVRVAVKPKGTTSSQDMNGSGKPAPSPAAMPSTGSPSLPRSDSAGNDSNQVSRTRSGGSTKSKSAREKGKGKKVVYGIDPKTGMFKRTLV